MLGIDTALFFSGLKMPGVREILGNRGLDSKAKKLYDELDVINMECPAASKKELGTFFYFFFGRFSQEVTLAVSSLEFYMCSGYLHIHNIQMTISNHFVV